MGINRIFIESEGSFGNIRFKRFDGYVYKFENNQKTEEVLGAYVIVESIKLQENFRVKLLNTGKLLDIVANSDNLFDRYVDFKNMVAVPYVSYGRAKLSISADSMGIISND